MHDCNSSTCISVARDIIRVSHCDSTFFPFRTCSIRSHRKCQHEKSLSTEIYAVNDLTAHIFWTNHVNSKWHMYTLELPPSIDIQQILCFHTHTHTNTYSLTYASLELHGMHIFAFPNGAKRTMKIVFVNK